MKACSILSVAPYRVLPATTGGHWGIVSMHDAIGRICQDHLLGTTDNGDAAGFAFDLHKVFPAAAKRYLPFALTGAIAGTGRRYDSTAIWCDHPYLAPSVIAASRRLKIPWFLRSHNIESERFRTLGKWWWRGMFEFERAAMRRAHGIFFITPEERDWAIYQYGLNPARAHLAPYGTMLAAPPEGDGKQAKAQLAQSLGLDAEKPWLYFLGAMAYSANFGAVRHIVEEVHPRLRQLGLDAQILVAGKGLPQDLQDAIIATGGAIRYTGFVENLDTFIRACDLMMNPVLIGGGIKTKAVEALGYNKRVVSTVNGAQGIDPAVCGPNLKIAANGDWDAFAEAIPQLLQQEPAVPAAFYDCYNWDRIAERVVEVMNKTSYR